MDYIGRNFVPEPTEFVTIDPKDGLVKNPTTRYVYTFHLNWHGHHVMRLLLESLGAGLSQWSGLNDGDFVDEPTCKVWAALLKTAVSEEMLGLGPVPGLFGGAPSNEPTLKSETTSPLSQDDKDWILSFAIFLDRCGGCEQW